MQWGRELIRSKSPSHQQEYCTKQLFLKLNSVSLQILFATTSDECHSYRKKEHIQKQRRLKMPDGMLYVDNEKNLEQ